jgi:glycerate kinase
MKIVVAPNAFKGSLTAGEAAAAMAAGVRSVFEDVDVVQVPVADGGDGLVAVAVDNLQGERRRLLVTGPCFDLVDAGFCFVPELDFVAVEMALASGLALLPEDCRDPARTTSFGTGELIMAALDMGVGKIGVGIGGSATNDGGIGMAAALGVKFLDIDGKEVKPVGATLADIIHIDTSGLDPRIKNTLIEAVCDVDNPLLGERGAARVYAPQKGATPEQVEMLEIGLANLAAVIEDDLGMDIRELPGGGAGGGIGAGLHAFLGARLRPGIEMVLELVGLDEKMNGADLVLTGEGQIDFQTAFGKAPAGVAALARKNKIPCIAIAGSVGDDLGNLHNMGISAVFSICTGPVSLEDAMAKGDKYLAKVSGQVVRCFFAAP